MAPVKRTGTCVAARDSSAWPVVARAFLLENFMEIGVVRVCGKRLPVTRAGEEVTFDIAIPNRYAIVAKSGTPSGLLDGVSYEKPRWLSAGLHTFRASESHDERRVMWAGTVPRR